MGSFEDQITQVMDQYFENKTLSKENIDNCRMICQMYEDKIYTLLLTKRLHLYLSRNGNVNDNAKINVYKHYGIKNDFAEHLEIDFGDINLNVIYDMHDIQTNTKEGMKSYTSCQLKIDNYLILKKECGGKKNFINLTYVMSCIENCKLTLTAFVFLSMLLSLLQTNDIFSQHLKCISENPSKYMYDVNWESDSDMSLNDEIDNKIENEIDNDTSIEALEKLLPKIK